MSFDERLTRAYEASDYEIKEDFIEDVVRECEERDIRGRSRPTIFRYFAGETEPSPDWIRLAADLLEVRGSWLAAGQGKPTPMRQAAAEISGEIPEEEMASIWTFKSRFEDEIVEVIKDAAPRLATEQAPSRLRATFWEVLDQYWQVAGPHPDEEFTRQELRERAREAASVIDKAARGAVQAVDGTARLSFRERKEHRDACAAVLNAFSHLWKIDAPDSSSS